MVAPESYELESALLARRGDNEIQLDLFGARSFITDLPVFGGRFDL